MPTRATSSCQSPSRTAPPGEERSNIKQDRFKLDTIERTNRYLAETFAPPLRASISEELGIDADVRPAEEEETGGIRVPADVRLLGDARRDKARDRAARVMDPVDDGGGDAVRRRTASRGVRRAIYLGEDRDTRAHVLGEGDHPPPGSQPPRGEGDAAALLAPLLRHVPGLGRSDIADRAIARPELLAKVVAFKEKFYRTPWSRLADARPGTIKLVPPGYRVPELQRDYSSMRSMIFGEVPPFEDVLAFMGQ